MSGVPPSRRRFFLRWQQGRCYLRGCELLEPRSVGKVRDRDASEDHVLPRADGGQKAFNSAFACHRCNVDRSRGPFTACMVFFAEQVWTAWEEHTGLPTGPPMARREAILLRVGSESSETALSLAFAAARSRLDNRLRRSRLARMQMAMDGGPDASAS